MYSGRKQNPACTFFFYKQRERTATRGLTVFPSPSLPWCAVGVCRKSSVTDLKSGCLPINIKPKRGEDSFPPLLLFHDVPARTGPNLAFILPHGCGRCPTPRARARGSGESLVGEGRGCKGRGGTLKNIKHRVINYCNDARREGEEWQTYKVKQRARASTVFWV